MRRIFSKSVATLLFTSIILCVTYFCVCAGFCNHDFSVAEGKTNIVLNDDSTHSYRCLICNDAVGTVGEGEGGKEDCSYTVLAESESTCTTKGRVCYVCSVCFNTKTVIKELAPHNLVTAVTAPTCTSQGYTTYVCTECDYFHTDNYVAPAEHISDGGVISKEPTYTDYGIRIHSCRVCKAVIKSEKIDKLISVTEITEKREDYTDFMENTTSPPMVAVKKLSVKSTSSGSAVLTWKSAKNTDKYLVTVYSLTDDYYRKICTDRNFLKVKKLNAATVYEFKVTAIYGDVFGEESEAVSFMTKPEKVKIKSVMSSDERKIKIRWREFCGADGYEVTVSASKKFKKKNREVYTVSGSEKRKLTIRKLKSNKTYYIKVRSFKVHNDKKIFGVYSKIKKVTVK